MLYKFDEFFTEFKDLYQYKNEIENLLGNYKSKFFVKIFNNIKDNPNNEKLSEQEIINLSINEFEKVKTLFNDFNNIDIKFFLSLIKIIKSKEELEIEINFLRNKFNYEDNNIKEIVDDLFLLKEKEDNITKLTSLITLIEKLNCNKTNLYLNLKEYLNCLQKDELKIQDFVSVNQNFKILNLKIFEIEKYYNVLNELMEKKELLDFLITKKYDDIRFFTEFFEDLDNDLIQIKD